MLETRLQDSSVRLPTMLETWLFYIEDGTFLQLNLTYVIRS